MKLWLTTIENKCIVKMLWYLLGECVKTTVLFGLFNMYFSFFFFLSLICALFSYIAINYIKSGYAATVFRHCSFNVFHYSSTVIFWWATFFFNVLNSSYSFFFFFQPSVCTFFFLLYILLYWHNKFHNIFAIIEVSISWITPRSWTCWSYKWKWSWICTRPIVIF